MGKFARVALGTRHIDYNGRLCMVSAGTAYKLAFGVDRSPIPWSDIAKAQVAACDRRQRRRVRADHDGLSSGGAATPAAKLIIVDPRMTPICAQRGYVSSGAARHRSCRC